ncbi:metal ABC transporter substrate-binding protein [Microbacterium sp. MEC084]|uniref:MetQ/NlpA family ABC transporter substrate-binding protein n=1 Tax=Microbacterium sp. MEC084 TaxID=1963027 RepID=UPI00106F9135|nr:MetQ/NlpA family ABC transporter substrate-binding protein [Microbacterium sp. MEC084]MCD1269096.1 metal ABC transporter substrate-binding protein [Microbacterium sp. MEC084]
MTDTPTLVKPSAGAPDGPDLELELKRRSKWPWIVGGVVAAAAIAAVLIVPRLGGTATANETPAATLYITTVEGQPTETALIEFVAEEVAPKYGIEVAFRGLADSTTLNRAVSEGEVAGTIYQHKLWLGQVLEANPDFQLEAATPVFRWGFGLWSDRWESVDELPQGATVSLYSDPANEAQGLWVLQEAGLIEIDPAVEYYEATVDDIVSNPKDLQFRLLDFAAQSRALPDLDAAVGYTEYYLSAQIPIEKQIFAPTPPDECAGQLTIGSKWKDTENIQKLVAAFQDPAVQEWLATNETPRNILLPLAGY